jgi:hypothetical protein
MLNVGVIFDDIVLLICYNKSGVYETYSRVRDQYSGASLTGIYYTRRERYYQDIPLTSGTYGLEGAKYFSETRKLSPCPGGIFIKKGQILHRAYNYKGDEFGKARGYSSSIQRKEEVRVG